MHSWDLCSFQVIFLVLVSLTSVTSQQRPDLEFQSQGVSRLFEDGLTRRVIIDNGHNNLHTADGGYAPFAQHLQKVGCEIQSSSGINVKVLSDCDIYITVNALHEKNVGRWHKPIYSAYTPQEIDILRQWVYAGGSIFIIVDHMPFSGAMNDLVTAFGFRMDDGFAVAGRPSFPPHVFTEDRGLVLNCDDADKKNQVATFTGSAFRIPDEAYPVIKFSEDDYYRMPDTAWVFSPSTPMYSLKDYYQLAYRPYGKGRVVLSGEAAMFTAQLVRDSIPAGFNHPQAIGNIQLLNNIIHYLGSDVDGLCIPKKVNGVKKFFPEKLDSDEMEYSPTWDDKRRRIYFTRRNGFFKAMGNSGIHYVELMDGQWSDPRLAPFSGEYSDSDPFIDCDNKYLYFTSNRPCKGRSEARVDRDIYRVRLADMSDVESMRALNSEESEYSPSLDQEGNIYFGSYRSGGLGSGDIWMAKKNGTSWEKPKNLGRNINTSGGEWGSCISADGQHLIFESSGRQENITNDGDLYIAHNMDNSWEQAVHLKKYSSHGSDLAPVINKDMFYFSSNRLDDIVETMSNNDVDIYSIPLEDLLIYSGWDNEQISMKSTISNQLDSMEYLFSQGSLKKIASFYTEDAEMYGPNGEQLQSRDEIMAYWDKLTGAQIKWDLDILSIEKIGDRYKTIISSNLGIKYQGEPRFFLTRAILLWKKEFNEWKIDLDFYHGL